MIGRLVLSGVLLAACGVAPSAAAPPLGLWLLQQQVCNDNADQSQCAIQVAIGNDNKAHTSQWSDRRHTDQLALTVQLGNDNKAFTGQVANERWTSQVSLTVQNGDGNGAFTYQEGGDGYSSIVQNGNGTWAASSSIGDHTYVNVTVSN